MKKPLLNDPDIFPSTEVLAETLGKSFAVFEELSNVITGSDYGLTLEWKYYHDGKAWLCKVCSAKKTIFWLSVWDGFFKTGFYFTEKTRPGVMELPIDENIKAEFAQSQSAGKLIPLSMEITKKKQLKDVLEIIRYKKGLK
jgi:hypothetical protein